MTKNKKQVKLYIKYHTTHPLYYFGRTVKNVETYKGSGTIWRQHLEKYGSEHVVNLWVSKPYFSNDPNLEKDALAISKQYNIVSSELWANCVNEIGTHAINSNITDFTFRKYILITKDNNQYIIIDSLYDFCKEYSYDMLTLLKYKNYGEIEINGIQTEFKTINEISCLGCMFFDYDTSFDLTNINKYIKDIQIYQVDIDFEFYRYIILLNGDIMISEGFITNFCDKYNLPYKGLVTNVNTNKIYQPKNSKNKFKIYRLKDYIINNIDIHNNPLNRDKPNHSCKKYIAISPTNEEYVIDYGIVKFCENYNLNSIILLGNLNRGRIKNLRNEPHHLGWALYKFEDYDDIAKERLRDNVYNYVGISPDKKIHHFDNLRIFSEEYGLTYKTMRDRMNCSMLKKSINPNNIGWEIYHYDRYYNRKKGKVMIKSYVTISPTNDIQYVDKIQDFCEEYNITYTKLMNKLNVGKISHINPANENLLNWAIYDTQYYDKIKNGYNVFDIYEKPSTRYNKYLAISPNGEEFIITDGIKKFCDKYNFNHKYIGKLYNAGVIKSKLEKYKNLDGWRFYIYDDYYDENGNIIWKDKFKYILELSDGTLEYINDIKSYCKDKDMDHKILLKYLNCGKIPLLSDKYIKYQNVALYDYDSFNNKDSLTLEPISNIFKYVIFKPNKTYDLVVNNLSDYCIKNCYSYRVFNNNLNRGQINDNFPRGDVHLGLSIWTVEEYRKMDPSFIF